jgi:hypothetical protein
MRLNHSRRTSSTGDSHTCGTHPVVAVVQRPFWPKIPQIQSFESSKAISMRWSRTLQIKSTQSCHKKDLQYWGDSHLPRGTHPVVAVVSRAHLAKTPQFNIIWIVQAISMLEQTLQIKSTPRHATRKDTSVGATPPPGTHPVVAMVSNGRAGLAIPHKFNNLSRQSHVWVGRRY